MRTDLTDDEHQILSEIAHKSHAGRRWWHIHLTEINPPIEDLKRLETDGLIHIVGGGKSGFGLKVTDDCLLLLRFYGAP